MEPTTVLLALCVWVAAIALRPVHALGIFSFVLFWYPEPLTVPLGPLDFSATRIAIIGLLGSFVIKHKFLSGLRWNWMDSWIVISFFAASLAYTKNVDPMTVLERQGGAFMDTVLPYAAVRMSLRSKKDVKLFFRWLVLLAVPLAIMGIIESVTGSSPYDRLVGYYSWGLEVIGGQKNIRSGFYRARGSFTHAIVFGLFFSAIICMNASAWFDRGKKTSIILLTPILVAGLCASMSSAPLFGLVFSAVFIAAYPLRRLWPVVIIVLVIQAAFIEVYSNRHFYHVMTNFALNAETAYYRIGLMEEAFGGGMEGHWGFGFGYVGIGPGNDNTEFKWFHQDLVNLYIARLVHVGLFGLIPFLILIVAYYRRLRMAFKSARTKADRWMIWCATGALFGWNMAMMTVSPLSQLEQFLYIIMAIACVLPHVVREGAGAPAPAPAGATRFKKGERFPVKQRWRRSHV